MAKDSKKTEAQAEAEERDEVLELETDDDSLDVSSLPTPEAKTSGGKPVDRNPKSAGVDAKPAATKAGKRSPKAQRETEAETERKAAASKKSAPKAKPVQKPNPAKRHGKGYRASHELIEDGKHYELAEAVELAKKTNKVKFDPSVEMHVNLGVDPKQAEQMVRGTVVLPHGTGKSLRVAVLAASDKLGEAKASGAELVSDGDLIAKIEKGQVDFDVLIATPDMMSRLSKVAKVLGPRGLMPNPKSGTVTQNVGEAVKQAKTGKIEFRIDKQAIVHLAIGKASFKPSAIEDNAKSAIDAIIKSKPSGAKGTYFKAITLTTSMGPGIKLDVQKTIAAANTKK